LSKPAPQIVVTVGRPGFSGVRHSRYVLSANGAGSWQPGATPQVLCVQKINSAESAIHAGCLTSAVIESRLQRLSWKTIFPRALPQAENEVPAFGAKQVLQVLKRFFRERFGFLKFGVLVVRSAKADRDECISP
jgi:hypothetical protein